MRYGDGEGRKRSGGIAEGSSQLLSSVEPVGKLAGPDSQIRDSVFPSRDIPVVYNLV